MFYLVAFLRHIAKPEHVAATKMNADNLAMVFAPSFFRCEDPQLMLMHVNNQRVQPLCKPIQHSCKRTHLAVFILCEAFQNRSS